MELNDLGPIIRDLIKVPAVTPPSKSSCLIDAHSTSALIYREHLWISATGTRTFQIRIASFEVGIFLRSSESQPGLHAIYPADAANLFISLGKDSSTKSRCRLHDFSALPVSLDFNPRIRFKEWHWEDLETVSKYPGDLWLLRWLKQSDGDFLPNPIYKSPVAV